MRDKENLNKYAKMTEKSRKFSAIFCLYDRKMLIATALLKIRGKFYLRERKLPFFYVSTIQWWRAACP